MTKPRKAARSAAIALAAALILGQSSAFGWGNNGHTWINQAAAEKMPRSMPKFLHAKASVARIAYLGPEPDRWREVGNSALNLSQAPDHFIDLERLDGLGDLPKDRFDFYRMLYAKRTSATAHADDFLPERVGLQPYITVEVMQRLEVAFRDYRALLAKKQKADAVEADILFYMGWLGHYVADGSQPLHTSVNYDGWVEANPEGYTTQHGIHWAFESDFVDRAATSTSFLALIGAPHRIADPFADYQKYLWNTHTFVPKVYELEKAKAFDGGTPDAAKFLNERLAAGAQMLLNLWYTAWLQSAEPLPAHTAE